MLTPDHPFRRSSTNMLRDIVEDPATYSVGERLDADYLLGERASTERALRLAAVLDRGTDDDRINAEYLRTDFPHEPWGRGTRAAYLDCMAVYAERIDA